LFCFIAAILTGLWPMSSTVVHRHGECAPPPPPYWEGDYPIQAPPSAAGKASFEATHKEEETTAILDRCGRLANAESE
jgi:hypothetical protein